MEFLRLYGRVLQKLGSDGRLGWVLAFGNVALVMAQFAEPVLYGRVIDTFTRAQSNEAAASWSGLWPLLILWVGFGLFTILCGALVALYADRLAHRRRQIVLTEYFEHVIQLPFAHYGEQHSGRLMKIMLQGADALWLFWLDFFRDNLAAMMALFVLIPLALFINWRLAMLLIALCIAVSILTAFILRKTISLQSTVESYHSNVAERAADVLGNIALVQSFARIEHEVAALKNVSAQLLAAQFPVLSWWAVVAVLRRAATTLTVLFIILFGTWLFLRGLISVGEIVTFMAFAGLVIGRLEQAAGFINRMAMHAPRLTEFFRLLDIVPEMHDAHDAVAPGRIIGRVAFENVSFSYDGKRSAVTNLSFSALPGETVALVGTTGAGKSTALALLYRMFDPQSGQIKIDGMNIRQIKLAVLRRNIGVVFQESLLFNRSIADNLRVGKPDATDDQIRAAAGRAQALDFIENNAAGFESKVGERGRLLSGGERQRLSIARALLKDPPILILDEATSALDAETESKVLMALDEVMKNRTTFVIAHRLATVRKATRILVFEAGRVVEAGSFDELSSLGGRFTQLMKTQFVAADA